MNMRGLWLHVMGDALGSIVVIVNAIVNWQVTNVEFLKNYLDPMLSLMMSLIIMSTSIPLLKESALILLQTVPPQFNARDLKEKLLAGFGHRILDVHEFHIWRLSGSKIVATAHIRCQGDLKDYMGLAEEIKGFFHQEGIHSTTVQLELVKGKSDPRLKLQCALKCPKVDGGKRECAEEGCCIVPSTPAIEVTGLSQILFLDKPPVNIAEGLKKMHM